MSRDNANWRNREEDFSRDYSRDENPRQFRSHSSRSFVSPADVDQNWRDRTKDVPTNLAAVLAYFSSSQKKEDENDDVFPTIRFRLPRYRNIREDNRLVDHFRKCLRYLGDYSEDADANYSLEKHGLHYLDLNLRPDDGSKVMKVNLDLKIASEKCKAFTPSVRKLLENMLTGIASQPDIFSSLKINPGTKRAEPTFVAREPLFIIMHKMLFLKYEGEFCATFICGSIYMECFVPEIFLRQLSDDDEEENEDVKDAKEEEKVEIKDGEEEIKNGKEGVKEEIKDGEEEEEKEEIKDGEEKEENENAHQHEKIKIHLWSHKYEQYMCGEDVTKGAIPNEQFRTVITTKLGPYRLLYNYPIDAVNPNIYKEGVKDLSAFLKFFLTAIEYSEFSGDIFNLKKPLEWIMPMLFGGIQEIIAGFCDKNGIATELRLFTVEDLLLRGEGIWDLNKHFTFLVYFMDFVKDVTTSKPGKTFFFYKREKCAYIKCIKVDDKFVPDWFIEKLNSTP